LTAAWTRVARADEIAGDGPHALSADGVDLVAVRAKGGLKVFEGRCPHQGALLGEGELEGGTLVCRNHRWRFDAATGKRDGGPQCLRACPSELRGAELWVDVAPLRDGAAAAKPLRTIADLPGPKARPLVGNALQVDINRLHLDLEAWARTYGPMFRLRFGPREQIGVSDPELIEQVLRARPETYRRDARVEPVFAELGVAGVFSAEGAAWRPQRRLAMEALSQRNLRGFYPTLARVAERLRTRWANTPPGAEIDIQDDLMRFTVDVTTTLVFGRDLNTLEGGEDVIQRDLAQVFPTFARRLNALIPYWRVIRLPRDRKVDRAIAALRAWLSELITETRARLAAEPERAARPGNFLEAMLTAKDDAGEPFSDEVLFGNAMTMLLAGEDTTANSVAWAVHLLCDHPAEVAALRAELDRELGDATVPRDLEQANRLDYATAISNEAMRLLPVAPLNFVQANHDTVLGDVEIPTGTGVVTISRPAATDARWFGSPAEFRPRRFLDDGVDGGAHDPGALTPFGSGPRICPGRTLALVEMRVMLATIYRNFDVERVGESAAVKEHYSFTVMPSDLKVRISRRKDSGRPSR
jgi:cytochrome P450/nitrite reductase/ring-hydroxylating ferredoxin subunit